MKGRIFTYFFLLLIIGSVFLNNINLGYYLDLESSLRLIDILAPVSAGCMFVMLSLKKPAIRNSVLIRFIVLIGVAAMLITAVSVARRVPDNWDAQRILRALVRFIEVLLLGFTVRLLIRKEWVSSIIQVLVVISSVVSASGIAIYLSSPEEYSRVAGFFSTGTYQEGILEGGAASFNEVGALYAVMLLNGLILTFGKGLLRRQVLNGVCVTMLYAGLIVTRSRSGMLSALIGMIVLLCLAPKKYSVTSLMVFCSVLAATMLWIPHLYFGFYERLVGTFQEGDVSYESAVFRYNTWISAIDVFKSNPLFGVGYACFAEANSEGYITPENYFLEIMADMGFVGISLWAWLVTSLVRTGHKAANHDRQSGTVWNYRCLLFPAIAALLCSNLTGNNFLNPGLFLLFLFYCSCVECVYQNVGLSLSSSERAAPYSPMLIAQSGGRQQA